MAAKPEPTPAGAPKRVFDPSRPPGRPKGKNPPVDEWGLLSREEVARRLDVLPATLSRWVAKGVFPPPDDHHRGQRWKPATIARFVIRNPLNHAAVAKRLGIAVSSLSERLEWGTFPDPDVRIGRYFKLWKSSTVESWIAAHPRK